VANLIPFMKRAIDDGSKEKLTTLKKQRLYDQNRIKALEQKTTKISLVHSRGRAKSNSW
jgi:hypothetical protein